MDIKIYFIGKYAYIMYIYTEISRLKNKKKKDIRYKERIVNIRKNRRMVYYGK